eukprot:scaffold8013_cov139-Amphora_coffeaeformis.AAC.3
MSSASSAISAKAAAKETPSAKAWCEVKSNIDRLLLPLFAVVVMGTISADLAPGVVPVARSAKSTAD